MNIKGGIKMKTQTNKFHSNQSATNKVMLFTILFFGSVLFIISGMNFWQNTLFQTEGSFGYFEQNNFNSALAIIDSEDQDEKDFEANLEAFENVSDDEIELVFVEELNKDEKTDTEFLVEMYTEKNQTIFEEIETEYLLANYAKKVEEVDMEVESWMTAENTWDLEENSSENFEEYLAQSLAEKNAEVIQNIESKDILNEYLAIEDEGAMEIENWMTDNVSTATIKNLNDEYLANNLAEKNNHVANAIEVEQITNSFLALETEEELDIENWMTTKNSEISNENNVEELLAAELSEKNETVWETIEMEHQLNELLAVQGEDVLAVEGWMTGLGSTVSSKDFACLNPLECLLAEELGTKTEEMWCEIEMENWKQEYLAMDSEAALDIEDWMINEEDKLAPIKAIGLKDDYLAIMLQEKNNWIYDDVELDYQISKCLVASIEK